MLRRFFFTVACTLVTCAMYGQTNSLGKRFYVALNSGFEAYYLHSDLKKAEQFFDRAFAVREPDIYSVFRVADVFFKEKQYEKFLKMREIGLTLGYHWGPDPADLDSAHGVLRSVPYYKTYLQRKDSLFGIFRKRMDIDFTVVSSRLGGADQLPRMMNMSGYKEQLLADIIGYADSINYFNFKEFVGERGAPKMNNVDFQTMNNLELFYMHIADEVDSAWGDYFLKRYFKEQYDLGNLTNAFIPTKIDRDIGGWNGNNQVFGFFSKVNADGFPTYDVIQNLATVDSLRTAYDLPVLAVDALMRGLKLPDGYKLYDRYTLLGK